MALIYSTRGTPLTIRAEDALWLARAVEAEGAPERDVAQVLVNRWAWLFDREGPLQYPTLTSLVRAYAQPVNPRWFPGGDLHEAYMRAHPDDMAELERARVRRDVHAERGEFSPVTRAAVYQALHGPITIEPGALHFGKPRDGQNQIIIEPYPALYMPGTSGPALPSSALLNHGRPHAVIGFLLLGFGGAFAWAQSHKKRRRS